jgi:PAS domain S-box-containing protein
MRAIKELFDTGGFSPHGFCLVWDPFLIWTGVISDSVTAIAYFSIPIALAVFLLKRRDIVFPWIFFLFGTFILLCGATHVLGAVTVWFPIYRLETTFKVLTAAVSLATAIMLWPLMPRALALPNLTTLRDMNLALANEVEQRRQAESSQRSANEKLQAQSAERDWSEQRFKLLVEGVSNYAILMLDNAGMVTSWNTGAERIKGYKDIEILGEHFSRFYTEEDVAAGKPQHALDIAAIQSRFEDEGWRVRKDSSRFWASVVITALRGADGQLLGYGKVTRDLTERRRMQQVLTDANEALEARVLERTESLTALTARLEMEILERTAAEETRREATELLEATFDSAPFPLLVTNGVGDVLMWSKAGEALFGFSEQELIAGGAVQLAPGAGDEGLSRLREAARSAPRQLELQLASRAGRALDLRLHVTPLFHPDGTRRATVTMVEDLTRKNLVEAQLRQSQKMEAIGTLTGGMAHDFNNHLGIIIGNLDLLRETRRDDSELNELTGEALDAAMRGADLTRSLLAFARRQPLRPTRLELDILIGGVVKLLSRMVGDDIEINVAHADNVCAIVADPAQLEASLTNLVTNARDAMPQGGKVTISTSHQQLDKDYAVVNPDVLPGSYALIEVTDSGHGMAPEVQSRIFEPFFTTKDERGTGLGLSMVFGFMKQSGGHISVYSELGVGTTFRLYFPCSNAPEDRQLNLRPDGPLAGKGETILAVEDNISLRRIVVLQLRALGYHVLEANNGSEALVILESQKIDLLFTDVVMPGKIDGFALADAAVARWSGVKVILTSGFPQSRFTDAMKPRPYPLLSKPYRKGNLAQMIRSVMDGNAELPNS